MDDWPTPRRDSEDDSPDSNYNNYQPRFALLQRSSPTADVLCPTILVGAVRCLLRSSAGLFTPCQTPPRTPGSPISLRTLGRTIGWASPSLVVMRSAASGHVGVVGRFINVAPHLLMMGISLQIPQLAEDVVSATAVDWWADMAEVKLLGPRLQSSHPHHPTTQDRSPITHMDVHVSGDDVQVLEGEEHMEDQMARGNQLAQDSVVQNALEAEVCLPLQTSILCLRPRLRRARTPVSVHSLRQSDRIAAGPRAPNTTRQAQNLLLKKLGSPVDEGAPDAEVEERFRKAFQGSMTSRKPHCLQMLLHDGLDLPSMSLDLADLGDGMV